MRTAVELDNHLATRLQELADAKGVSVEELIVAHVPGLAGDKSNSTDSGEERVRAFEEWVAELSQNTPLSDEAISRASIYRDR